jgi:PKD repeat protein
VKIYNGQYALIGSINIPGSGFVLSSTLVQDIDHDGLNELLVVMSNTGTLYAYDTYASTPTPQARGSSLYYSERRMGAGEYVPLPGAPQPIIKEVTPTNQSLYIKRNPTLSAHVIDFHYDRMNIDISTSTTASGPWTLVRSWNNVGNDVYTCTPTNMNSKNTRYYWRVTATDPWADNKITQQIYSFITASDTPEISNINPLDQAKSISVELGQLQFTLNDYNGNQMTYTVQTSPNIGLHPATNVYNGTILVPVSGLSYFTTYHWYINVTDGTNWNRKVFSFMTKPQSLIADSSFNDCTDSSDLRTNGPTQDWYESYNDNTDLLILDTSSVGGNSGKKAKLTGNAIHNVYLSQELTQEQSETFSIQFDVCVDEIINGSTNVDLGAWIFIGDDADGINGPCSSDQDRYVVLAFRKDGGGTTGPMQLVALDRYDTGANNNALTRINQTLLLDTWYTIRIDIDFTLQRYNVYLENSTSGLFEYQRTIKSRTTKDTLTHISFANLPASYGIFFIDNVISSYLQLPPVYGSPTPANGSIDRPLSFNFRIPINDPTGDNILWTIRCSNGDYSSDTGVNGTRSLSLSGLAYSTTYTIWVNATDTFGSGLWTSRWYTFTTASETWSNRPPTFSSPSPVNGSTNVNRYHTTNVTVSDLDGNLTTVCFWYSLSNSPYSWTKSQQNNSVVANSIVRDINSSYTSGWNTQYWWKVTAFDGHVNSSVIYTFTTKGSGNNSPVFGAPSPGNGSTGNLLSLTWSIPINDLEGNVFSWTIQCSNGQFNSGIDATNGIKSLLLSGLTYSTPYKVWVNATDPAGSGLYTRRWFTFTTKASGGGGGEDGGETPNSSPTAGFSYSPSNPTVDDTIQFTDTSSDSDGTITSWFWNFSDGINLTSKNPQHKYDTPGQYTVVLEVTDNDGAKKSISKIITINQSKLPNNQPTANFSFYPSTAKINDTIQFTDTSIDTDGIITLYLWNFGDGTTSTSKNPTHRYTANGTYSITLEITDNDGAINLTSKAILVDKDSTDTNGSKGTPGFELIFTLCAIAIAIFLGKRKQSV